MTPFITSDRAPGDLQDSVIELWRLDAALSACVPPSLRGHLAYLLRAVNSFYSNKIEGNPTLPSEILHAQEMGAGADLADDILEMKQHIEVQKRLSFIGVSAEAVCSPDFLKTIHREFYEGLPEKFLIQVNPETKEEIVISPGQFRDRHVQVGRHIPPVPDEIADAMQWFSRTYRPDRMHGLSPIFASAASHHRFMWIHPFLDGNGRVGRIFTDCYMRLSGLSGYGLWSMNRGFGRDTKAYYSALSAADQPRKGDLDGRGILSDDGLLEFTKYFIEVALDQVRYFSNLYDAQKLNERIEIYFEMRAKGALSSPTGEELSDLRIEARDVYKYLLQRGEQARSDIQQHLGLSEKTTRSILQEMVGDGLIHAPAKGQVSLRLPIHMIAILFPHLW